jgi:hypothetical protein
MSTLQVENLIGPTSGSNANKVIIPSGQTLDIDAWTPPSGTVLQVVNINSASTATTTSTSWTNTGVSSLNTTITPTSTSSKIYMVVHLQLEMSSSSIGSIIFARDPAGTPVYFANSGVSSGLTPGTDSNGISKFFLSQGYSGINGQTTSHAGIDTPNTTSSVTYGILWGINGGTGYFNRGGAGYNGNSSLTLMEIAG